MPRIYLSPSTQDWNPYVDGSGSEEYWMNLLADTLEPYLYANTISFVRNTPEMTAASSIAQANSLGGFDFYLALHSNASGQATATLGEVRRPRYPANLIELGYHDNYDDARWIENNLDAAAQAIARGLTEYFGLPFIYPHLVRTGVVTTEGSALRLRSYPGIDGETVGSIPNGESVQVYGSFQGWYSVGYDGQLGYAAQAYIAV